MTLPPASYYAASSRRGALAAARRSGRRLYGATLPSSAAGSPAARPRCISHERGYRVALLEARLRRLRRLGPQRRRRPSSGSRPSQKALKAQVGRGRCAPDVRSVDRGARADPISDPGPPHRLRLPAEPRARRDQAAPPRRARRVARGAARRVRLRVRAPARSRRARRSTCAASAISAGSSIRAAGICIR